MPIIYVHSQASVCYLNIFLKEIMAFLFFFPFLDIITKYLKEQETKWLWIYFHLQVCPFRKWHKNAEQHSQSAFFFWDRMPPRRETDPPGIISEIFCAVLSALIPLDVSFFFLLARRCGLCYASAKPNRPRNGGVCQNTQRKMFWKGTSQKVGTRSYGKTWSGRPPNCGESPLSVWETGHKELPAHRLPFKLSFADAEADAITGCHLQSSAQHPRLRELGFIWFIRCRRLHCRDLLLAPPSVVQGPFCQAEQTRAEPITFNGSVFSDNPFRRAQWPAASFPKAYLSRRMRITQSRSLSGLPQHGTNLPQPVGTFCSHYIPTGMLDVGTKIATIEFLQPDNLAHQMESFSEAHLFTLCFLSLFVFPSYYLSLKYFRRTLKKY